MPRPSKGARLYLRKRPDRAPVFVIKDSGGVEISTGTESREQAERLLAEYIGNRHRPDRALDAESLTIAQALTIYAEDHAPSLSDPARVGYAIDALDSFWGDDPISSIKGARCRTYATHRNDHGASNSTVRRELGVLQAALNHCAKEGHLLAAPRLWRPEEGEPRLRWLTRTEAAWMLRAARRLRIDGRHLAKFILVGYYTGTRKSAILSLRIDQPGTDGGWIDTENGILYRKPIGRRQTKKRQTPARVPRQLLAHVKRWKANGARFVVQDHEGNRIGDIRKGWARMVELAEELSEQSGRPVRLRQDGESGDYVTPHVLKHTACTWAMQRGADLWDAASFFGTSVETLEKVYGHHHPDHQGSAVAAMESRVSGARPRNSEGQVLK